MKEAIRKALLSIALMLSSPFIIFAQNAMVDNTYFQSSWEPTDTLVSSSNGNNNTIPPNLYQNAQFGEAYHREKAEFMGAVVAESTIDERSASRTSLHMGWGMLIDGLIMHISGGLSNYSNIPFHKLGNLGMQATQMAEDQYSMAYTLTANITDRNEYLDLQGLRLTEEGRELADENHEDLLSSAGDEYLSCITYGAGMAINFKIHFQSAHDKYRLRHLFFFKDNENNADINPEITDLDDLTKRSVFITVRVLQRGGLPSKMLHLIPEKLTCNLTDPEPCYSALSQALIYAKTQFPTQLNTRDDYVPVLYRTERYDQSPAEFRNLVPEGGYPIVPISAKRTLTMIESDIQDLAGPKQRALDLFNLYQDQMTSEQADRIQSIYDAICYNEDLYIQAHTFCLDNPLEDRCEYRYQETKAMAYPIDFDGLEF